MEDTQTASAAETETAEQRIIAQAREHMGQLRRRLNNLGQLRTAFSVVMILAGTALLGTHFYLGAVDEPTVASIVDISPAVEDSVKGEGSLSGDSLEEVVRDEPGAKMLLELKDHAEGTLGKMVAVMMILVGVAQGVARQSLMGFLVPMPMAFMIVYGPHMMLEFTTDIPLPDSDKQAQQRPNPLVGLWETSVSEDNWQQANGILNLVYEPGNEAWLLARAQMAHLGEGTPELYLSAIDQQELGIGEALQAEYLLDQHGMAPADDGTVAEVRSARETIPQYAWPVLAAGTGGAVLLTLVLWPMARNYREARRRLAVLDPAEETEQTNSQEQRPDNEVSTTRQRQSSTNTESGHGYGWDPVTTAAVIGATTSMFDSDPGGGCDAGGGGDMGGGCDPGGM